MTTIAMESFGNKVTLGYAHKPPTGLDYLRVAEMLDRLAIELRKEAKEALIRAESADKTQ